MGAVARDDARRSCCGLEEHRLACSIACGISSGGSLGESVSYSGTVQDGHKQENYFSVPQPAFGRFQTIPQDDHCF